MTLPNNEIKKIADLARIVLTSQEIEKFNDDVTQVIELGARELADVSRSVNSHSALGLNLGEPDVARPSLPTELALANSKDSEQDFFVVPKVFE